MNAMASQITGVLIVCSAVCPGSDKKKTSKLRVTGFCEWNQPVTGESPSQRASNAENVSIWWRDHGSVWKFQSEWQSSNLNFGALRLRENKDKTSEMDKCLCLSNFKWLMKFNWYEMDIFNIYLDCCLHGGNTNVMNYSLRLRTWNMRIYKYTHFCSLCSLWRHRDDKEKLYRISQVICTRMWGWWLETLLRPLKRHSNELVMLKSWLTSQPAKRSLAHA